MKPILVLGLLSVIALGCSSGDSGGGSSPGDVRCTGTSPSFPTFDKSCTSEADCVLVNHTTSCCGDQLIMAINGSEQSRFQSAESICDQQYPGCGCASQGPGKGASLELSDKGQPARARRSS